MKKLLTIWKKYSFLLLIAYVLLGLFDMRIAIGAILCMIAPMIVSLYKGRFWCGNLCPRGSFYDNIVVKFSNSRKVPKLLKSKIFRAFMVVFIISVFTGGILKNWGNPYGIGMVFYRMIVVTTMIGILLSLVYNHRTWCSFCPMGTLATLITKARRSRKVLQVTEACVSCRLCEKKCPLGIVPYHYRKEPLHNPNCIQCGKCASICPKNAICYKNNNCS